MKHHQHSLPGIYRITRISDGKVYIGQAKKISQRWASHKRQLFLGKHRNWPLQEAWALGVPDDFTWDIVCQPIGGHDPETMTFLEYEVMTNYPDRFNLNEPIQAYLGAHASTRAKLSKIHKKLWEDPDFQARVKATQMARMADPETRAKNLLDLQAMRDNPEIEARRKRGAAEAWGREDVRATQGAKTRAHWEDPEHRAKQKASREAVWQDPEKRGRRMAGLQGSWDRLTPEERAARSAKMRAGKTATPEERSANVKKAWEKRRANAAAKAAKQTDLWDGEVL